MANIAPSFVTVNPSYTMPELLLPYSQASGAFDLLATGEPMQRLADGDLYAYIKRADVRTKTAAGQAAYNSLPSVSIAMSQISTPTYLQRVRAEYDHHDTAAMGRWGVGIAEAQRLGMHQGHFQLARGALLYGFNPANGEGLLVREVGLWSIVWRQRPVPPPAVRGCQHDVQLAAQHLLRGELARADLTNVAAGLDGAGKIGQIEWIAPTPGERRGHEFVVLIHRPALKQVLIRPGVN